MCAWDYGPWIRQPLRVVLDSELRCTAGSRIFDHGNALIFAAVDAARDAGSADARSGPDSRARAGARGAAETTALGTGTAAAKSPAEPETRGRIKVIRVRARHAG